MLKDLKALRFPQESHPGERKAGVWRQPKEKLVCLKEISHSRTSCQVTGREDGAETADDSRTTP